MTAEIGELEVAEALYVRSLGGRVEELEDGLLVRHPTLTHAAFNGVLNLTSSHRRFVPFIESSRAAFEAEALPFAVVVSPASTPPDAAERLQASGFWHAGSRLWMEVAESVPERPPDDTVQVAPTQDPTLWAQVVAEGVGLSDQVPFLRVLAQASREATHHRLLVARYKGTPAGACEVTRDDHIAFVRHLGVRPAFRRRGVAHALLHQAFKTAEEFGAVRLATRLIAPSGYEPTFERYGFVASHLSDTFVHSPTPFTMD